MRDPFASSASKCALGLVCACDHAVGGHECSMHRFYICWSRIFSCVSKIQKGLPAVSSMTTPQRLRVHMLRIYSAVILVLAINH